MDLLKEYLAALGGTATALLLIGFLGKSMIEQWLKQNYKAWELNAEKPYKEDFKRFEDKLNGMASRDATRYTFRYIATAKAINKLAKLASSTQGAAADFLWEKATGGETSKGISDKIAEAKQNFYANNERMLAYKDAVKHLLDDKIRVALGNFALQMTRVDYGYGTPTISEEQRANVHKDCIAALESLQDEFTRYLRSDEIDEKSASVKPSRTL